MRRSLLLTAVFFFGSFTISKGQDKWQGTIGVQRLLLQLKADTAILEVPERKIRVSKSGHFSSSDSISFSFAGWGTCKIWKSKIENVIEASISHDKSFSYCQLYKVDDWKPLELIQSPQLPLPYKQEKVQFRNSDNIVFDGIFSYGSSKPSAAVILLSGTGKQDKNGTMAGHPYFEVLADYLTRNGIAVLRFDDRGVGGSTGVYEEATTFDFAKDGQAAFNYLDSRPEVDRTKIGVIGHSEGAAAAIILASMEKRIKFLISLSGLTVPGLEAVKYQNNKLVEIADLSEELKERSYSLHAHIFDTVYRYALTDSLAQKVNQMFSKWKSTDDSLFKLRHPGEFDHFRFPIYLYTQQIQTAWYRYHICFDPAPFIQKLSIPVLCLNGDKDVLVDPSAGALYVYDHLNHQAKKKFAMKLYPNKDHLLQNCTGCNVQEAYWHDITFPVEVMNDIAGWIKMTLFNTSK